MESDSPSSSLSSPQSHSAPSASQTQSTSASVRSPSPPHVVESHPSAFAPLASPPTLSSSSSPSSLRRLMRENPFFAGGAGVATLGFALSFGRRFSSHFSSMLRRTFSTSIEIHSRDPSYQWVLDWLGDNHNNNRDEMINVNENMHHRHQSLNTNHKNRTVQHLSGNHYSLETQLMMDGTSGQIKSKFAYRPAPGHHWIKYKEHTFIKIERDREKSMIDLSNGHPFETIKLTAFSFKKPSSPSLSLSSSPSISPSPSLSSSPFSLTSSNTNNTNNINTTYYNTTTTTTKNNNIPFRSFYRYSIFDEILTEAQTQARQREEGKTIIYNSLGNEWCKFGRPRTKRPLHSVILKEGLTDLIINDITEFTKSSQWYLDRGIPYRRGYLFHGPPVLHLHAPMAGVPINYALIYFYTNHDRPSTFPFVYDRLIALIELADQAFSIIKY